MKLLLFLKIICVQYVMNSIFCLKINYGKISFLTISLHFIFKNKNNFHIICDILLRTLLFNTNYL